MTIETLSLLEQIAANHARSEHYRDDARIPLPSPPPVRLIAYYLPQYHPIPENDAWWGKGFTEWTNVTKALPRFKGHYQPHLPGELGFYDLRDPDVLRRQADLVRAYGLAGLCFHHYWFAGRTLLDTPIRLLLNNPDIDLPFCVNWANENWTRHWNGGDREILVAQAHSAADDRAFAASLEPLFRDPRYIRINGRPLLMVYRPKILPNPRRTMGRLRAHFRAAGLGDPYLVMAQSFGDTDPRLYDMDAAAGFPPHNHGFRETKPPHGKELLDPGYRGSMCDYAEMAASARRYAPSEFRFFPGVCPSWDNEARQPGAGVCFVGATPAAYGEWLAAACASVSSNPDPDERIVFINAWNEWAEGAHLEPDRHLGFAYLVETARVVCSLSGVSDRHQSRERAAVRATLPVSIGDLAKAPVKHVAHHAAKIADRTAVVLRKVARL
jgi:lipopolysaccharide biosynthesis protein